jgi:hypothetical protein
MEFCSRCERGFEKRFGSSKCNDCDSLVCYDCSSSYECEHCAIIFRCIPCHRAMECVSCRMACSKLVEDCDFCDNNDICCECGVRCSRCMKISCGCHKCPCNSFTNSLLKHQHYFTDIDILFLN